MGKTNQVIRLGSRGSKLALWQAEFIQFEIERRTGRKVEITSRITSYNVCYTKLLRNGFLN